MYSYLYTCTQWRVAAALQQPVLGAVPGLLQARPQRCGVLRRYDGTVRSAGGSVVQFLYGEDGMDGTAIEAQKLESLRMSPNKFRVCGSQKSPRRSWQGALDCMLTLLAF